MILMSAKPKTKEHEKNVKGVDYSRKPQTSEPHNECATIAVKLPTPREDGQP